MKNISTVTGIVLKTFCSTVLLVAIIAGMSSCTSTDAAKGSSAAQAQSIPLVYTVENTGAKFPAPPLPPLTNLPIIQPLPDPFAWAADPLGKKRSTKFSDWEHHRNEIAAQIENYEIGTKPPRPQNITASYTNGTLKVMVTENGQTLTLTSRIILPAGAGPFPAVIGMNSPSGGIPANLFATRKIAEITFSHDQVTTYNRPGKSDPYYRLYPDLFGKSGQYSAWAWGVSRIIDGLELVTNDLPIDLKHLCVTGCSYAGKMALFSGAFDERIALTIAQESGGGGATSWRYSATEKTGSVEGLAQTSHQWFMQSMFQFGGAKVSNLPEDHHELMALCAPRALLVTGNTDYLWLSNPSCYVCSRATQQIYNILGISDRFGFVVDGGHGHCQVPNSQIPKISAFLDKFMLGITNADTTVHDYPTNYATIDYARWYQWWGTGKPVLPPATNSGLVTSNGVAAPK
jgi:hypothetical protein